MPAKTVKRESPYLRVGTTIYKRVRQPLSSGRSVETLIPWNVETLRQDYGKSYLACIPKYDGFCTVPDHTNYRREIDGFLNRYEPIPFQPADGIFPHIHDFSLISSASRSNWGTIICNCSTCAPCNGCRYCCWCRMNATRERRPFSIS